MNLTMKDLENCFRDAQGMRYQYIAVKIDMQGFEKPEIIINRIENFDAKLEYYKNAYDENLVLKANNGIRIIGFMYSDVFEDIEEELAYEYYRN